MAHLPYLLGSSHPARVASQEIMTADAALTVLLPIDPPKLSSGAARILLEVLLDAVEDFEDMAASKNRITPTPLGQEVTER